jgi:hypothetical protein
MRLFWMTTATALFLAAIFLAAMSLPVFACEWDMMWYDETQANQQASYVPVQSTPQAGTSQPSRTPAQAGASKTTAKAPPPPIWGDKTPAWFKVQQEKAAQAGNQPAQGKSVQPAPVKITGKPVEKITAEGSKITATVSPLTF